MFKEEHRTTSKLESYNAILNSLTPKGGHFFKVLERLNEQITNQSRKLLDAIQGESEPAKKKSKKQQNRDEIIDSCSKKLEEGIFNVAQFLDKVIRDNNSEPTMETFYIDDGDHDVNDESEDSEEEYFDIEDFLCWLCAKRRCNILLETCHHNVLCSRCFSEQNTTCPKCNHKIDGAIEINY